MPIYNSSTESIKQGATRQVSPALWECSQEVHPHDWTTSTVDYSQLAVATRTGQQKQQKQLQRQLLRKTSAKRTNFTALFVIRRKGKKTFPTISTLSIQGSSASPLPYPSTSLELLLSPTPEVLGPDRVDAEIQNGIHMFWPSLFTCTCNLPNTAAPTIPPQHPKANVSGAPTPTSPLPVSLLYIFPRNPVSMSPTPWRWLGPMGWSWNYSGLTAQENSLICLNWYIKLHYCYLLPYRRGL